MSRWSWRRRRADVGPVETTGAALASSEGPDPDVLTVYRYADVQTVLEDPIRFTTVGAIDCGQRRPLLPLQSSLADHPRHRTALEGALSGRLITQLEPELRDQARRLIDAFPLDTEVDVNAAMCRPFPVRTLLLLLGLPQGDHDTIRAFHDGVLGPFPAAPTGVVTTPAEVGQRIYEYFESVVRARRASPGRDLISLLQERRDSASQLSDAEIVDVCYLLVLAGIDPVARALTCAVAYFASRPQLRAATMAQPRQLRRTVDELLRWGSSVELLTRIATTESVVAGSRVDPGARVMCALAQANRDPGAFEHPAEVDPNRRRPHLAFGSGPHHCVAAHLARLQIRVVLEELHRLLPEHGLAPSSREVDPSRLSPDEPLRLVL